MGSSTGMEQNSRDRGAETEEQDRRLKASMDKIKQKIVVLSGKGGVGKSKLVGYDGFPYVSISCKAYG